MHFCIFKRNETLDVLLLPHKGTNMHSFVNLSKGHICPCLFPSIDAASRPSLADPILHFFIIFRNTYISLPIPFLWAKKKAPAMRKVITGAFNVSFIDFLSLRYHCSRIFAKHSLQYTGRSDLGSNGTRASPPQEAQVAVKNSRGPRAAFLRASRHALQRCGSFWKPRSA